MKNTVALIALAGIASVASAQNFELSIVPSSTAVAEGESFTLSIFGDADVGTHLLGGAFTLTSDSALVSGMSWTNAAWSAFNTDGGYAGNGNYNQVIFGQLAIPDLFPPAPNSELGSLIGTFQVDLISPAGGASGNINFQLGNGTPFTLQTIDMNTGALPRDIDGGNLILGSASVTVGTVPAPSALALLGLGGIAAGRRRR